MRILALDLSKTNTAAYLLNRGVGRMRLFDTDADYAAFERVLAETPAVRPMRVVGWCVMPNHWHLLLWPREDGDLASFMQRLTITHVRRWVEFRHLVGCGHVYQGRFKSFPVQSDEHFLTVLRYVERNPLRAGLVKRAEEWRWSSLMARSGTSRKSPPPGLPQGGGERPPEVSPPSEVSSAPQQIILSAPPVDLPRNWVQRVNRPESAAELEALRVSVSRGRPFGGEAWTARMVRRLGLESSLRSRGSPRKRDKARTAV